MTVQFSNNASTTLAAGISAATTSCVVAAGTGALFPAAGAGNYFYMTLVTNVGTLEIVKVTSRSGDVLTMDRGQEGSVAIAFATGSKAELRVTAAGLNAILSDARNNPVNPAGSITGAMMAAATVTFRELGDGSVVNAKYAANSIDNGKLQGGVAAANLGYTPLPINGGRIFGRIWSQPTISSGYASLDEGNSGTAGLIQFFTADNVRRGYIGYGNGPNLLIANDGGWNWQFLTMPLGPSGAPLGYQAAAPTYILNRSVNVGGTSYGVQPADQNGYLWSNTATICNVILQTEAVGGVAAGTRVKLCNLYGSSTNYVVLAGPGITLTWDGRTGSGYGTVSGPNTLAYVSGPSTAELFYFGGNIWQVSGSGCHG